MDHAACDQIEIGLLARRAEHILSLGSARVCSTDDPGLASTQLQRTYGAHRMSVLGDGTGFNMRLRVGTIGSLALASLRFNAEVKLVQEPARDFVLVTTQLRGSSEISTAQESHKGGCGLVVVDSATRPVVKQFSADSERLNIRVDHDRLCALAAALLGRGLDRPLEFLPVLRTEDRGHRRWLAMARMLLEHAGSDDGGNVHADLVNRRLEEMVMLLLLTEHRHSYSDHLARTPATIAPRHVRAAEEFIRANAGEALTLQDIARAARVSIRTLTAAFQAYRETSPMRYLREVRLDAARQDLMRADTGSTVSDIALRWGFGNLGRFSGDYRRRFGERPSSTLRRAQ